MGESKQSRIDGQGKTMTATDIRHARLRIAQLLAEAERETRTAARKELRLTAATIQARIDRAVRR